MSRRARHGPTREPDADRPVLELPWTLRYDCKRGHGELGRLRFSEDAVVNGGGFRLDGIERRWEALDARVAGQEATGPLPGRYRLTCEVCARAGLRPPDLILRLDGLLARTQEAWLRAEPSADGVRVVVV